VRQARFGVRKSSDLGLISPWNLHTRGSHRCQEEVCTGFLPRFARLRSQQAFEQGQKNTSTCSTRPELARACPAPEPARQATPVSPARARAYKASQGFNRTPPCALDLTGARDRRSLLCTRRASGRPSTRHHRPASRAIPTPSTLERDSTCLGEAPGARNQALPRRRRRIKVTGLHPTTSECRPSSTVSYSSIPCTGRLLSTP
jgi:hypothetical protein